MRNQDLSPSPSLKGLGFGLLTLGLGLALAWSLAAPSPAHIVPAEKLHPVAESYRRLGFVLHLNPVVWNQVETDLDRLAGYFEELDAADAASFRTQTEQLLAAAAPEKRTEVARALHTASTRAVAAAIRHHVETARAALDDYRTAVRHLEEARLLWAAFEPTVAATDPEAFRRLGECWLELASALGHPGLAGRGAVAPDHQKFAEDTRELAEYLDGGFADRVTFPEVGPLRPLPAGSPTFDLDSTLPTRLPPGHEINKQLPRPRQVLNMATRGVDEGETTLIALGDMAFDSALIFGEPARSLGITCNTCHNKSITNPQLFIPGLSVRPGGLDVSNSFFAPHANNGHFDPLDIPDLRGIRFTGPYGRNGRFASLREFTRNVIVNEFNGPEPDPLLLDGLIAYMLEFDFLPNPALAGDGSLAAEAPAAAKRGEAIFQREFEQMGRRSCASCHDPSDHFLDRKRHDIGSVAGSEPASRDRALDTPTLLSVKYTAPYFHDGRLPTLDAVSRWFNDRYELGLSEQELADLTAYVETVGDGVDGYEDTVHTLEAELEEFSFFLSTYEFLGQRGQAELVQTTLATIAFEIRAHKWDVQDQSLLPVLDQLAELMDQALAAHRDGQLAVADAKVAEYRELYQRNAEVLK